MENYIGVIPDPRSIEQKANDYQHSELYGGASPYIWTIKPQIQWAKWSIRDQDGSSSCVEQGTGKGLETKTKVPESARNYALRDNPTSPGMYLQNAGSLAVNAGTDTEQASPSQNMSEAQMNEPYIHVNPLKVHSYVFVSIDIDQIAQVVRDQGHCMLTFETNYSEWTDVPKYLGTPVQFGHCVCVTDATLWETEKALIVDESWKVGTTTGFNSQRVIVESFLLKRCTGAMYLIMNTPNVDPKPIYKFLNPLSYGVFNGEVTALQNILRYEGFFPSGTPSTGYFGNVTANSLKKWQISHGIMDFANETNLINIRFGAKSIALANNLYN
jgi:hypothetical protein